ncbi:unnamed protein product, partial [Choristocarpus tenellus]
MRLSRCFFVFGAIALVVSLFPLLLRKPNQTTPRSTNHTPVLVLPPQGAHFVIATLDIQKTASTLLNGLFCEALEELNLQRGVVMGTFRSAMRRHGPSARETEQEEVKLEVEIESQPEVFFRPSPKRKPVGKRFQKPVPRRPPEGRQLLEEGRAVSDTPPIWEVKEPNKSFFRYYEHGRALLWSHNLCSRNQIKNLRWCPHHPDSDKARQCVGERFGRIFSEDVPHMVYVTFLRDPVQRVASEYHHLKGNLHTGMRGSWLRYQPKLCNGTVVNTMAEWRKDIEGEEDIGTPPPGYRRAMKQWVEVGKANPANNRMVRHIAGPFSCANTVEEAVLDEDWMIKSAIQNLRANVIFGFQDRVQESLELMNMQIQELLKQANVPVGTPKEGKGWIPSHNPKFVLGSGASDIEMVNTGHARGGGNGRGASK